MWTDIPGFPGYQACKAGDIKRLERTDRLGRRVAEQIMTGTITESGHRRYLLGGKWIDGHVAVLTTFVGPRPPGMEACHNNGDGLDNRLENLRWDTRSANILDKIRHGKHPFASREECKRGHQFTPENTHEYISPSGQRARVCRACNRERMRELRSCRHTQK